MAAIAGKAIGGGKGGKVAIAAAKKTTLLSYRRLVADASWGSAVNTQIKGKETPAASSEVGKFLNIVDPPLSDLSALITRFIKLNNRQNPGMKKDVLCVEKLKSILAGKDRVGAPEIAKLLSQQFVRTAPAASISKPQ